MLPERVRLWRRLMDYVVEETPPCDGGVVIWRCALCNQHADFRRDLVHLPECPCVRCKPWQRAHIRTAALRASEYLACLGIGTVLAAVVYWLAIRHGIILPRVGGE